MSLAIGFSRPKCFKPGAQFIRAWQGWTPYSHVYIKVYSKYTDLWLVYQASHGDVNLVEYNRFAKENVIVDEFNFEVREERLRNMIREAQLLLQSPYGYLGLLKLGARKLLGVGKGDGVRSFHCSELVARLLPEIKLQDIDPDFIEPKHVYAYVKERYIEF